MNNLFEFMVEYKQNAYYFASYPLNPINKLILIAYQRQEVEMAKIVKMFKYFNENIYKLIST